MKLAWAAQNGFREVVTWTQRGNEGMRRVNELLGYEYRDVSITMVAPLPLKGLGMRHLPATTRCSTARRSALAPCLGSRRACPHLSSW